jgi:hypothetical protein
MVHEDLHRAGWTHLLEHMALHGRGGGALAINGSVGFLETTFDAHGPVDLVARHLSETSAWLDDPDLADLERERNVLRAEGRTRGGMATDAMLWRYGAGGPGLCALDELGLGRATEEGLRGLARTAFTRSNAVLALDGPPPSGLRLTLPDGDGPRPIPMARPCDQAMPACYRDERGVLATGTTRRSVEATLIPGLLQEEFRAHLRNDSGASYAPWASYEAVDRETAVIFAGSDVDVAGNPRVARTVKDVVDRLAQEGPTEEALRDVVDQFVQTHTDPYNAAMFAWRCASRTLMGFAVESSDEILAQITQVTPGSLAADLAAFRETLLLGRPNQASAVSELPILERPVPEPSTGKEFRSINWPGDRSRLTVGDHGIQVHDGSRRLGVRSDETVGVLTYSSGHRTVVGRDGWNLQVDPDDWIGGTEAVRLIDAGTPEHLRLPQPDQDGGAPVKRLGFWKRWWTGFRRSLATRRAEQVMVSVLIVLALGCLLGGVIIPAIVFGVWAGRMIRDLRASGQAEIPDR